MSCFKRVKLYVGQNVQLNELFEIESKFLVVDIVIELVDFFLVLDVDLDVFVYNVRLNLRVLLMH